MALSNFQQQPEPKHFLERINFKRVAIIVGLVFLSLIAGCNLIGIERIESSHEAVKINLTGDSRGVDKMSYVSGYVFYNPLFTQIVEFPISTQTVDYPPFDVSATGTNFTIDPTLSFSVKPQHTGQVYGKYRRPLEQIEATAIASMIKDAYKNTARHYKADSLILQQSRFESEVESNLRNQLDEEGFKLDRLTSSITPPESYQKTINAKNEAVQKALQIENEVNSAIAQGKIRVAEAQAESQASKIEADARAYKNEKEQQTLTPLLIEQQRISKWDGHYPTTITGSGTSTLLSIK